MGNSFQEKARLSGYPLAPSSISHSFNCSFQRCLFVTAGTWHMRVTTCEDQSFLDAPKSPHSTSGLGKITHNKLQKFEHFFQPSDSANRRCSPAACFEQNKQDPYRRQAQFLNHGAQKNPISDLFPDCWHQSLSHES